jgi:hypothetical protein
MKNIKAIIHISLLRNILISLYLCLYLALGAYTELRLIEVYPLPDSFLQDFRIYERALDEALNGGSPYNVREIGGYLYPPPALLIVEAFNGIQPALLEGFLYALVNTTLLMLMTYGIARNYGYSSREVWYWYIICLGFAPFLELIHIGQINIITMFGIFLVFIWGGAAPIIGGMGLGLAIITKVTPLFFLGPLVATRKYKAIATSVGLVVIFILLGILRYGLTPTLEYPAVFRGLLSEFPLKINSQSLVARLTILKSVDLSGLPDILHLRLDALFSFVLYQYPTAHRMLTIYILGVIALSCALTFLGRQTEAPSFIVTALGMMLSPNILWYHHYVFILLPLLVWMGWSRMDKRVVLWCLAGLILIQFDHRFPPYGLLIHIFGHASLLAVLTWQVRQFFLRWKEGQDRKNMAMGQLP